MARGNFDRAFDHVIGSEGGFQADPKDRGNWTTGTIGKGVNKGTKWGISAMSYPSLDIKNLSQSDAKRIYKKDYWDRAHGDELPAGVDLVVFDAAVNSGLSRSAKWLQQALGVKIDGLIGPDTIAATKAAKATHIIDQALKTRLEFLEDLPTWARFGNGWRARVNSVKAEARKMAAGAAQPPAPAPPPEIPTPVEQQPTAELAQAFTALVQAFNDYLRAKERAGA